jgi:hypothetical protein
MGVTNVVAWPVVARRVSMFVHGTFDHGTLDHGRFDHGMFDHTRLIVPSISAVAAGESQGRDCHQNSGGGFINSHWLLSLKISGS